jgi:hypothetical protein
MDREDEFQFYQTHTLKLYVTMVSMAYWAMLEYECDQRYDGPSDPE